MCRVKWLKSTEKDVKVHIQEPHISTLLDDASPLIISGATYAAVPPVETDSPSPKYSRESKIRDLDLAYTTRSMTSNKLSFVGLVFAIDPSTQLDRWLAEKEWGGAVCSLA